MFLDFWCFSVPKRPSEGKKKLWKKPENKDHINFRKRWKNYVPFVRDRLYCQHRNPFLSIYHMDRQAQAKTEEYCSIAP